MIVIKYNGDCILEAITNARIVGGRIIQCGWADRGVATNAEEIPDQDLSGIYSTDMPRQLIGVWPESVVRFTAEEKASLIDRNTGEIIDEQIHHNAGVDESIGILRDQMVQWGNALGLDFTEDFTRLNGIAIAAIEDGVAKKAKL